MNRIVLIGNGFDLAHGLKTSYADFIEWYWRKWGEKLLRSFYSIEEDELCLFKLNNNVRLAGWYYTLHYYYQINPLIPCDGLEVVNVVKQNSELFDYTIKNLLFQEICDKKEAKNWVDIEDEYYSFLKSSDNPKQINVDLGLIKGKLVEYLVELQNHIISNDILNPIIQKQILEPIKKEDISIGSIEKWNEMLEQRLEYQNEDWRELILGYNIKQGVSDYSIQEVEVFKNAYKKEIKDGIINNLETTLYPTMRLPDSIMLLNFNYTNTADMYIPKADKFLVNHIHGSLSNPESVIFGYGDELDDAFNVLLDKKDNEYLRNIKSIRYQEVPNYRNMLRFIESSPYQIYIMGHSCGNSDRTMLNTLFEHRNCVSIKPFYHKWDDGTDNYMEIVQNIARNFTDMKLMRDRVVNKTFCETI